MRRTRWRLYYQGVFTRCQILTCTLLFASAVAPADTLLYTITGTFPSDPVTELDSNWNVIGQAAVPVNPLMAPGATYQFQFSISTASVAVDEYSQALIADTVLDYAVNGQPVFSSPNTMVFFSADVGGFVIPESGVTVGSDVYYWSWLGPQLFSGTTDAPTFLTGTFAADGINQGFPALQFVGVNDTLWELPDNAVATVTSSPDANTAVSEPGTDSLLAVAGMICLAVGVARGGRRAAHLRSALLRTTH